MKKTSILALAVFAVCAVCIAGCSKGKINEDNGSDASVSKSENTNGSTDAPIADASGQSKKLSAAEVKKYQEDCRTFVRANMENNDNVTNQVLEDIEAGFADLREVTPDNYAQSESFTRFAKNCTYLDLYLEEDTPGDQVGVEGFKYVKKVLQHKKNYEDALDNFQEFYSDNIEELYDHCYYTGSYVVGNSKITEGEYVLFTDNPDGATYTVYEDADSNKIVFQGSLLYDVMISLKNGERLELGDNCKAVPMDDVDYIDEEEGTMFKIDQQLEAGKYKLKADGEGSYQIITDLRAGDGAQPVKFTNQTEITVKEGEYLKLENAHILDEEEEEE